MARYSDTVVDQFGNAVSGVQVSVYPRSTPTVLATLTDDEGDSLSNPVATDEDGLFSFNTAEGDYILSFKLASATRPFHSETVNLNDAIRSALAASTGASLVGFTQSGTGAVARTVEAKLRDFAVSPEDFGAVGDNATDDGPAIQNALDAIAATGKMGQLRFSSGKTYYVATTAGLTADVTFVSVDGDGATLRFANHGLTLTGSGVPPYDQGSNAIENLKLVGPGTYPSAGEFGTVGAGTSIGINFEGVTGTAAGPQHIKLIAVDVKFFDVNYRYGTNAILIDHIGCESQYGNTGLYVIGGDGDTTEGVKWFGGTVFGCGTAIVQSDTLNNGSLALFGTHLDYNGKVILVTTGALVRGFGLWIEAADYESIPFEISGDDVQNGLIYLDVAKMLCTATSPSFTHIASAEAGAAIFMDVSFLAQFRSSSDEWFTGAGDFWLSIKRQTAATEIPHVLRADRSLRLDAGFESADVLDDIFVTAFDEANETITDRLTAQHTSSSTPATQLTLSATQAHGGSKSLRYYKKFAAGAPSAFALHCSQATRGDSFTGKFWYRKPGSTTGSFNVNFVWAAGFLRDSAGRLTLQDRETFASQTVTLTGADSGWVEVTTPNSDHRAPDWATHFLIEIDGTAWASSGEFIYVDDINMARVGL